MLNDLVKLLKLTKNWKRKIFLGSIFAMAEKFFDIFPEIIIGVAVDLVVKKKHSLLGKLGINNIFNQLLLLGIITFLIWMCESLFEYLGEKYWKYFSQDLQHNIRVKTYKHVQKLDISWFNEKSTGNILNILNEDINKIEKFFDTGIYDIIQLLVSSILTTSIFFYLAPKVAIFSTIPIPFILLSSSILQKFLVKNYLIVRKTAGLISSKLNDSLQGITVIKSYVAEKKNLEEIQDLSDEYKKNNENVINISILLNPIIRTFVLTGFLVTMLYGGWLTLEGRLALGSYTTLIFLTLRMLWPFRNLTKISDSFQKTVASSKRILMLLNTKIQIKDKLNSKRLIKIDGEIEFSNVYFGYNKILKEKKDYLLDNDIKNDDEYIQDYILENLSFKIHKNQYVGLIGATGTGKSTIIRLLLRFYDPIKGNIFIDGKNLKDIKLEDIRRNISLVDQNAFLFEGTILDNLTYGIEKYTEEDIKKALKIAQVEEFINSLPLGYNTQVGERGARISGGQRQRICIARAIVKNSKILIFDEATSAVDNETEAAIQKSLLNLKHSRTMIVIAHRLSTVRFADKIYVLSENGIAEEGTHDELIKKRGIYNKLWSIQTGQVNGY